ncbi:hypothetical protein RHMOL_Rhmol08G0324900 [Rhododendron molle]|uniref:Uncharacterized protein n=1 Tax=Rhododendron molle TaxID=49168 RepID=A0ACC0MUV8_RHOML|nr:hypothetical protein RHMOL_Rhmol08G0324900 [Rhododendron molle]
MSCASSAPQKSQTVSSLFSWIYNLICMHFYMRWVLEKGHFLILMNFLLRRMKRP